MADLVHGQRPAMQLKVHRSLESLLAFCSTGQCYASISWGRDSVIIAHLIAISGVDLPLVHLRVVPTENPHTSDVRDSFLRTYPKCDYREIVKESKHLHSSPTERMAAKATFGKAFRNAGFDGWKYISGVRASESGARKMRMRTWGASSLLTCAPIGWWTDADVFGYLATMSLPVHPNYAMLGGGRWPRERIRVSELAGEYGMEWGRAQWEQEYYGDIINRLNLPQHP